MAYKAKGTDKNWFVDVDGKKGAEYNYVSTPIFSPDSKHVAYIAIVGNKWFVVVDRKEGKKYAIAITPIFSPGSMDLLEISSWKSG